MDSTYRVVVDVVSSVVFFVDPVDLRLVRFLAQFMYLAGQTVRAKALIGKKVHLSVRPAFLDNALVHFFVKLFVEVHFHEVIARVVGCHSEALVTFTSDRILCILHCRFKNGSIF